MDWGDLLVPSLLEVPWREWATEPVSRLRVMVVWTLRLGTGGGVLAGLEAAVGSAVSDTEEAVYKVSRDVVLMEEALEADPEIISTAFFPG